MAEEPLVLHRGVSKSRCRSCKAEIVFAESSTTGKLMPFELDPNGRWFIENGKARYVGEPSPTPAQLTLGEQPKDPPPRYTSHFSACPFADKHRKPRDGSRG